MRLPWELILCFGAGLALMLLLGRVMLAPMRFFWRILAGTLLGALLLGAVNIVGGWFGLSVAINPMTALLTGFLGAPGAALIVLLTVLL